MLAISSYGSICIRCTLRRRIFALQQSRQRSSPQSRKYTASRPAHFPRRNPFASEEQDIASILDNAELRADGKELHISSNDGSNSRRKKGKDLPIRYNLITGSENKATRVARARWAHEGRSESGLVRKQYEGGLSQWGLDNKSINQRRAQDFREALMKRLNEMKEEVKDAPMLKEIAKDVRETDGKEQSFNRLWKQYTQKILQSESNSLLLGREAAKSNTVIWDDLRTAYQTRGVFGLDDRIKYSFYGHVNDSRFSPSDVRNQKALADLRYPTEWYPATRGMKRKIHLHVGPTNSGKTYHALQRLEQAERGVYAGPLRLLAHEVYTRLNAKGKPCALITGEERRAAENQEEDADMSSCTVEMVPLNKSMDVAVIDEIQMIGSADRGWAWTQALLGVKAKEVHLCGEERTVPLLRELCASIGEELEIHRYTRLSPLQVADQSLDGRLNQLRRGDCIVSFTVMGIHALRREIEKTTGRKVAIVYGSLPPETRAQQARLFNDPNNDYDFLVASDAVGMGLNLAIKRIIFETASKFDGTSRRTLSIADIKQIGGRAGRYRTAEQANNAPTSKQDLAAAKGEQAANSTLETPENVGLVTTLERFDFPIVSSAMESDPEPIQSAGIFPPASVLERFSSYFPPRTPFSYILTRLHDISQMHKRFHLCGLKDQIWIADLIEQVEGLTVADRNVICSCPASKGDQDLWKDLMPAYARCIADQTGCNIVDVKELPLEILEAEGLASRQYLRELERLHKGIVAYLWLSYRFAGIFNTRPLAFHVKSLVEEKIERVLGKFSFSETQRRRLAERREKEILEGLMIGSENRAHEPPARAEETTSDIGVDGEQAANDARDLDVEERDAEKKMAELAGESEEGHQSTNNAPQYDGLDPGAQLEGDQSQPGITVPSEDRSLAAGGDRFGGEEETSLEEPGMEEIWHDERSKSIPPSKDNDEAGSDASKPARHSVQEGTPVRGQLCEHDIDREVEGEANKAAASSGV